MGFGEDGEVTAWAVGGNHDWADQGSNYWDSWGDWMVD